jgi:hypothetical protein
VVAGGEREPAREDQGARVVLAGGDVMVRVNWRGGTTVTREGGSRAQLRRWSRGWGKAPAGQGGSIDHLGEG